MKGPTIRVVPLGGLGEIGLNLLLLEHWPAEAEEPDAAVIIDCGVLFPTAETPGVDLILPDFTRLRELGDRLLGVLVTHGHEDHVGALPFLLAEQSVPVYGTRFTIGLVERKLKERSVAAELHEIESGARIELGPFVAEPFHMTHSIVDACGYAIETPVGTIVHTGDFKLDHTPVDGRVSDLPKLAELGSRGVRLLFSDSTNADRPGTTASERAIVEGLEQTLRSAKGRVIAATFSSHIHRIQQLADVSFACGRQVALLGRSLIQNVEIATRLGRLELPDDLLIDPREIEQLPPDRVTIVSTGSQGEPRSALARIAKGDHRSIAVGKGDVVIFSARLIPGNERAVGGLTNHLSRRGAEVVRDRLAHVHTSGHASQEELKTVLGLVRPELFVPVHGEHRHLSAHLRLAHGSGLGENACFLLQDGETLVVGKDAVARGESVDAGRVFVDGRGGDDLAEVVLRDRRHLAEGGFVLAVVGLHPQTGELVAEPELVSRGVVFEDQSQDLLAEAKAQIREEVAAMSPESRADANEVKEVVRLTLRRFFKRRLDRRPMILPFIMEV